MSEKISDEEFLEKLKYYDEHKSEIERKKRKADYLKELERVGKYFEKNYLAGKILAENGYQIFDLKQADDDFRKVMKLDEIQEIAGVYEIVKSGKKVPNIVPITKSHFYNAFYEPIWKNLAMSERLKAIEWMFESINESHNLGIKSISYFPRNTELLNANGYFNTEDFSLFFNISDIMKEKFNSFEIASTMAHELMHARQAKLVKNFDYDNKYVDMYTLSQTDLGHFDFNLLSLEFGFDKLDYATKFALYRVCKSEKTAELQALKTMRKYHKLNEQKFGKNKSIDSALERFTKRMLFTKTQTFTENGKKHFYATDGIVTNEQKVLKGQAENLLKIIMLKNLYEYSLQDCDLTNEMTELEKTHSKEELDKLIEDVNKESELLKEKISLCKAAFIDTIELGKLPEYFTEKEFEPLQIIDEPKLDWSLPKWLRKAEEKYKKMQIQAKRLRPNRELQ